jgi:branched-chain amino acid aminotransferase
MPIPEVDKIWFNGELVPWHEAKGTSSRTPCSMAPASLRASAAITPTAVPPCFASPITCRIERSAKLYYMEIPYSLEQLHQATFDVIKANELPECYIRP